VMARTRDPAQRALATMPASSACPRLSSSPMRLLLTLHHCSTRMALRSSRCCTGARRGRGTCPRARAAPPGMHKIGRNCRGPRASTTLGADVALRDAPHAAAAVCACGGGNARERRPRGRCGLRVDRCCMGLASAGAGPAARIERASAGPSTTLCKCQRSTWG
jgi:hypothetical protein